MANTIITKIKQELKRHDKPANRHNYQRFHKEKLENPVGLKAPVLYKISKTCFKDFKNKSKKEILDICDEFLKSGERYFKFFAFDWSGKFKDQYDKADFKLFERWLKKYVASWGQCDHLCCRALGYTVQQYPEMTAQTKIWTRSKNRWERRAAAVSLIKAVSDGQLLDEVFKTADLLLTDENDMVQKGYGWMLKDASKCFPDEVFAYVMRNKDAMPRTALRYAIERYPQNKRKQAMA